MNKKLNKMNKKQSKNKDFTYRCYDLAYQANGRQSPNPMVGAVITYNDRIIGEGFHQRYGTNHAEINAIHSVKDPSLLKKAAIYVSLEPCFHTGKTPPCVQKIIEKEIKQVHISIKDINPLTAGKSIEILKNNHFDVQEGLLVEKGKELIRHFTTNIEKKRPYILLKYAISQDGFMGKKNEQIWLSNPFSKRLVHLWRSKFDAILTGGNTARTDNPQLSTRFFDKRNPLRVILTKSGHLSEKLHIFDQNAPTLIATTNHKLFFPETQTEVLKLNPKKDYLRELMEALLAQKNIGTIIIEGGAETLQSFIDANLWDEARVIKTPKILKNGIPMPNLPNAVLVDHYPMDTDDVFVYRNELNVEGVES